MTLEDAGFRFNCCSLGRVGDHLFSWAVRSRSSLRPSSLPQCLGRFGAAKSKLLVVRSVKSRNISKSHRNGVGSGGT